MKKHVRLDATVTLGDAVALGSALPAKSVNLCVADPIYNMGVSYEACDDNKSYAQYADWTRSWLKMVVHALHPHGALWIFIPDEWVSEIDCMARHTFKLYKQRHVIWAFTFGQACARNFSRSHCHLLYLSKIKGRARLTFNDAAIRVPSARQLVFADKRANPEGKLPDDTWMLLREQLEPCMTPDRDVWMESRICGTFRERVKHSPNQIPAVVMRRILLSTSNPGDLVLDPFAGTGVLGVECAAHGRRYLGYDVSATCVERANASIQEAFRATPPARKAAK